MLRRVKATQLDSVIFVVYLKAVTLFGTVRKCHVRVRERGMAVAKSLRFEGNMRGARGKWMQCVAL